VRRIPWLLVLAATLFGLSCNNTRQLTDDEKRTLELKPAVVLVVVTFKTDWALDVLPKPIELFHQESGTGFIYRPDGYIVTNGHVVEHANLHDPQAIKALDTSVEEDFINALKQGTLFQYIEHQIGRPLQDKEKQIVVQSVLQGHVHLSRSDPTIQVYLANGAKYPGDILQYSPPVTEGGKDVAVVKIAATNLPTVTLGNSDAVRVQDPVMVIGYPGLASPWGGNDLISGESSFVPTATDGHISAVKTSFSGNPLLQSDAAITHGNSGGPAFNQEGQVIGIATAGADVTQGFNWFVPMKTAMEFVRQAGSTPESGTFNEHWAHALDLFDEGRCDQAIQEFDNVAQFMPNLPEVAQYRQAAVQCWDSKNPLQKLMLTSGWILYLVIGIIIVAGAALLMRKRPAPAPALARAGTAGGGGAAVTRAEVVSPGPLPTAALASYGSIQATAGALSGKTFKITKEGLMIGRSPKCQIVLADDTVSGEHAWIVPLNEGVVVIDKGSSNGTYVNSVDSPKVSKVGLRNGDRIFIGKKGANVFTYFNS
jgi:serine protease Do